MSYAIAQQTIAQAQVESLTELDLELETLQAKRVVQSKEEALNLLQVYRQQILDFGVQKCGIFGSFVHDREIHENSDVDILVIFKPQQKTFDNFMALSFFLENLFGRSVDLVTLESLSPYIGPHILAEVEYVFGNS